MEWHLLKVNAHTAVKWSNKTGIAAAHKQTGLKSFMITRFLLLALNSVFQRFLQCLLGIHCYNIALPFKCMLAVYHST